MIALPPNGLKAALTALRQPERSAVPTTSAAPAPLTAPTLSASSVSAYAELDEANPSAAGEALLGAVVSPSQPVIPAPRVRADLMQQIATMGANGDLTTGTPAAPSDDPANADVVSGFNDTQRAAYNGLSEEERRQFNEEYRRAAGAEEGEATQAAMAHTLEVGLTREYLSQSPEAKATYVELVDAANAEEIGHVDQLLSQNEVEAYLDVLNGMAPDSASAIMLKNSLFNGTLLAEDGVPLSSLDYLADFANQPGEFTPEPMSVNRQEHLTRMVYDLQAPHPMETAEVINDCGGVQGMFDLIQESPASFIRSQTQLAQDGRTMVMGPNGPVELTFSGPIEGPYSDGYVHSTQQIYNAAVMQFVDAGPAIEGTDPASVGQRIMHRVDATDGVTGAELARIMNMNAGFGAYPDRATSSVGVITIARGDDEVAVNGQDPTGHQVTEAEAAEQAKLARQVVDQQLDAGETVWIATQTGAGEHWASVERVGDTYIVNDGLSGPVEMTQAEFDAYMSGATAVVYDTEVSPDVPTSAYNPAHDDNGGQGQSLGSDPGELQLPNRGGPT